MVNEEIICPLALLYLYLSFLILATITIYPSLTLKLLYLFHLPIPFFSHSLLKSLYIFTFPPNLFTFYSPLSLSLCSSSFFSILLLFPRLLKFFCTAISTRISGLAGASFW